MHHYRILGALSATCRGGIYTGLDNFAYGKPNTYGIEYTVCNNNDLRPSFLDLIGSFRVVFWGEIHSVPGIISMQKQVLLHLARSTKSRVHVVLEHFSFDMQDLLDEYREKTTSSVESTYEGEIENRKAFEELVEKYHKIGTEGHDLVPYRELLEISHHHPNVYFHAGFIPRTYARLLMKTSDTRATLEAANEWLGVASCALDDMVDDLETAAEKYPSFHYNQFESLLTGRSIHHDNNHSPTINQRFRPLFRAQLLKDITMAHKVSQLMETAADEEKFLVIAGNGHVAYYQGVPERVLQRHPELSCAVVTSHEYLGLSASHHRTAQDLLENQLDLGPPGSNPADFVFVYETKTSETEEQEP